MTATNSEHWCLGGLNKTGKVVQNFRPVVIEVTKSAAQDDSVGLKFLLSSGNFRNVSHLCLRFFHQPGNVAENIFDCQ